MLDNEPVIVNNLLFVNHLIGNAKGSHTVFSVKDMLHYQLLYKLSGDAVITFDNKKIRERADDLRLLPNAAYFDYEPLYAADVIEEGESINIGFTTNSPLPNEILVKRYSQCPNLKQLFIKLQQNWYYKETGYYYKSLSILYEIFSLISKAEAEYLAPKSYKRILPALEYIDKNFANENIDCKYLAKLCNVSYNYMASVFKKQFGMPPNKYIASKKIQYTCELLKTGYYNVNEIAEMAGFSSHYYFSRVFKNFIGVPPSKYL